MDLVRDIEQQHLQVILELNNQHVQETSFLDSASLKAMVTEAFAALQVADGRDGFLIAFDQSAKYASPNFLWFKDRYETFVYVDRIITARHARGRGIARGLYEALFSRAGANAMSHVGCEVNIEPPNPVSDAFHQKMGFDEVGSADLDDRAKTVRYLLRTL